MILQELHDKEGTLSTDVVKMPSDGSTTVITTSHRLERVKN